MRLEENVDSALGYSMGASFHSARLVLPAANARYRRNSGAHRLNVQALQAFRLTKADRFLAIGIQGAAEVLRWTELPASAFVSQMKSMAGPIQIRSPDGPAYRPEGTRSAFGTHGF